MNTVIADDNDITPLSLGSALTKLGHGVPEAAIGYKWKSILCNP